MNHCSDCFGCIGLKKGQYCILNKQYTKEEYEALVPQIIEHMKKTGEWGEFFPIYVSPFGYNETLAQEYFPLTKEACLSKKYSWQDSEEQEGTSFSYSVPVGIDDVTEDILKQTLTCSVSKKSYRIVKAELDFYRKMKLPLPRLHPDERYRNRIALRNPRQLWDRTCAECSQDIHTTYSPDRPEKILCEACYQGIVN